MSRVDPAAPWTRQGVPLPHFHTSPRFSPDRLLFFVCVWYSREGSDDGNLRRNLMCGVRTALDTPQNWSYLGLRRIYCRLLELYSSMM